MAAKNNVELNMNIEMGGPTLDQLDDIRLVLGELVYHLGAKELLVLVSAALAAAGGANRDEAGGDAGPLTPAESARCIDRAVALENASTAVDAIADTLPAVC